MNHSPTRRREKRKDIEASALSCGVETAFHLLLISLFLIISCRHLIANHFSFDDLNANWAWIGLGLGLTCIIIGLLRIGDYRHARKMNS
jgi:hydrogenase-4 membrane subunit HyfE